MQQSLFRQNSSLSLQLLIIVVLCFGLMVLDHRQNMLAQLRVLLNNYLIYPFQYTIDLPSRAWLWSEKSLHTNQTLRQENAHLLQINLELQARQQKLASLLEENARLRNLLNASAQVSEQILVAEIIAVDQDFYTQQILLNKGKADGVYVGQPIIDAKGVMGQIIRLNNHSATALLISDPSHALPVLNNRNGVRTIAQGNGNPHALDLLYIPNNTDILVGDLIVTSGLGGRFPADYPVGIITEVIKQPGKPFAKVIAMPTAQLNTGREVLLVQPQEQMPEQP